MAINKKQDKAAVMKELSEILVELYVVRGTARELEYKKYQLESKLDEIIKKENN